MRWTYTLSSMGTKDLKQVYLTTGILHGRQGLGTKSIWPPVQIPKAAQNEERNEICLHATSLTPGAIRPDFWWWQAHMTGNRRALPRQRYVSYVSKKKIPACQRRDRGAVFRALLRYNLFALDQYYRSPYSNIIISFFTLYNSPL